MQFQMIINGVDFSPYIAAGGITDRSVVRQSRDIVALDGTLYRKEKTKASFRVQLVTLQDATWNRLRDALTNPADVRYTAQDGRLVQRTFYLSSPSAAVKTVKGGNTYYSGVSFELEAK